ncbi:hypothetical protein IF1G_00638 [Cordyceps javanica]|uniref:Uncharacterized protein n=1 Tax=Cordyceps javanica TaxID=43265 RepID=A0A545VG54_9HYPO|nr:hypothetical protein IF1G_00638 [Cordyceps javanica]
MMRPSIAEGRHQILNILATAARVATLYRSLNLDNIYTGRERLADFWTAY